MTVILLRCQFSSNAFPRSVKDGGGDMSAVCERLALLGVNEMVVQSKHGVKVVEPATRTVSAGTCDPSDDVVGVRFSFKCPCVLL